VPSKAPSKRRSGCPVSIALDIFGDRWSLLIVRDMMVRGYASFQQFETSGEGIASNILASRLKKLAAAGVIAIERDTADRRKIKYRLTPKGMDLAPVLLEMLIWAGRYEKTEAPCAVIDLMASKRRHILNEVRRRWRDGDPRPLQVNGRWMLD
jgi:DNA-binding HxlR family transcriptional regulator